MSNYLSLEEAAKKLGIKTDRLVELRSQGQVRGFRDGASWKFPETEIERLSEELADTLSGGSGVLVSELEVGSSISGLGSSIIGADDISADGGSDLEIGSEKLRPGSGSDVNLVAGTGEDGSDVLVVTSGSGKKAGGSDLLLEIDSSDLTLEDPAIMHDSGLLDLDLEPNAGSTGPITDQELKELADSNPDVVSGRRPSKPSSSDSNLEFGDDLNLDGGSGFSFTDEEDSDDEILGGDSAGDVLSDDVPRRSTGASSLELMSDLDSAGAGSGLLSKSSLGNDVLSELDLLSAEAGGSGLISGESDALLGGSSGVGRGSLSGVDDALDDDDDLMIADDDDDLVISNSGGDISIAGDSGINLMSPSDSGLSLESEPLDLAGSGISALDLGAELNDGGSGSGIGSGGSSGAMRRDNSGSAVDFDGDEEFQLSPSGVGFDTDLDSGSQVIEVEDSEAIGEPVEFGELGESDPFGGDAFGADPGVVAVDDQGGFADEEEAVALDDQAAAPVGRPGMTAYEVPFTLMQTVGLVMIICVLSLGGMLMTDLIRNMWAYQEPAAPVSSLTDSLISLMGWGS